MLKRFEQCEVEATWATVGFLFAKDRKQLKTFVPSCRPAYVDRRLDPYKKMEKYLGTEVVMEKKPDRLIKSTADEWRTANGDASIHIGRNELDDPYHYGYSLIQQILETAGQELASHTFSHYYCLERGQDENSFRADLAAAQAIAKENFGMTLRSMVFPYNQFRPAYLKPLREAGFTTYRSNPSIWFWEGAAKGEEGVWKRGIRLLDHYLPFDRDTSYHLNGITGDNLIDLPASRFLFPYNRIDRLGAMALRVRRIKAEMTYAARTGRHYHLWWHPHNLAAEPNKMMKAVDEVLTHYRYLRDKYGMESRSMGAFGVPGERGGLKG